MTTARNLPPTWDQRCGTTRGSQAHSHRGERACDPCRAASAEAARERRNRPRPPRPAREAMEGAACWPAVRVTPGVMLHDCRHPYEKAEDWETRLATARAICHTCSVRPACKQLDEHYRGRRNGIDGILDGRPTSAPLYNRNDHAEGTTP